MPININKWDKGCIKVIAALEREIFSCPWNERMIEEEYNNPLYTCLVAKYGGEIAGYAGFYSAADEIQISNIAVKKEYRRLKIASGLISKIIEHAYTIKASGITLEVRASNSAAIALYKKFGFAPEGLRKKYYGGAEDAVIMWKHL